MMRFATLTLTLALAAGALAAPDLVGIWKPGIKHAAKMSPADAKVVQKAKAAINGGSLKLNKDKTFGMQIAGRVMLGSWSVTNNVLTINVKEVVGQTAKAVAKMPASEKIGKFRVLPDGVQMVSLPEPAANKPRVMWRKQKA